MSVERSPSPSGTKPSCEFAGTPMLDALMRNGGKEWREEDSEDEDEEALHRSNYNMVIYVALANLIRDGDAKHGG
jgi:hypothetical protein